LISVLVKVGDRLLKKQAEKYSNTLALEEFEKGKLSFKLPKADIPFKLTDYLSDEEVGQDNTDLWEENANKLA
jgi:hypothetical protein